MRLLSVENDGLSLKEFWHRKIPEYAILSHTWGNDEVSFQDIESGNQKSYMSREGYRKIKYGCRQARLDGIKWIWIDTICIDKTSSAELSEAINSMFRWYQNAKVCYAYLVDVSESKKDSEVLLSSRWWTRGTFRSWAQ
jgi:hypothetical protein